MVPGDLPLATFDIITNGNDNDSSMVSVLVMAYTYLGVCVCRYVQSAS